MHDERRLLQFGRAGHRRDRQQVLAHLGIALVAELLPPVVLPGGFGLLEIRHEVRLTRPLDDPANSVVIDDAGFERQPAAIASAAQDDPVLVEIGLQGNPIQQSADVFDRALASGPVIQVLEGAAKSRRAPHIRKNDRDAKLVQEIVAAAHEVQPIAKVRTAVK